MILPDKHIRLAECFLGLGHFLLGKLTKPQTIDSLWKRFLTEYNAGRYPAYHSFDNLILTLGTLYALGMIESNAKGEVFSKRKV